MGDQSDPREKTEAPEPKARPGPSPYAGEDLQPRKEYPPIEAVNNALLTKRDMLFFIAAAVDHEGLVGHNINGFNRLLDYGINEIMTRLFNVEKIYKNERTQTEADRRRKSFQVSARFHDVKIGRPTCSAYVTGQLADLYPGRARLTGVPYSGPMTLGATLTVRACYEDGRTEEKVAEIPPFQIGAFPIMVGSSRCHTFNCTRAALKGLGEDPLDPGGYFIAKRGEYVVDLLENLRYNSVHVHRQMKPNEHVRAEILSQPGGAFENSSHTLIRYATNGQITVGINSVKFEKVRLPFWLVYRLLGLADDRAIVSTVVFDAAGEDPLTARMVEILERAFWLADAPFAHLVGELDREVLVRATAEKLSRFLVNPSAYLSNEHAVQYLNYDLLHSLDQVYLPHLGVTAEARPRKLRFTGLMVRRSFLVHLRVLPPSDRDGLPTKRLHGADISIAKAFKTQVNNSIVGPIYRKIKLELKNNPWASVTEKTLVDTFRSAITTTDLNRALETAIVGGNKTIIVRRRAATNRVSSQALERKNMLNTLSALRTIVTQNAGNASKQTERADMMRRVHPTYTGFVCVTQSADTGEVVGMRKQLAITSSICAAGEDLPLRLRLLADPALVALDAVTGEAMVRERLARVFVGGQWVGCCRAAHELVGRYRALRREGRAVDPTTTIYWNPVTDEVEFWLDVGRLRRPLLVVDNNLAAYDAALFARRAWRDAGGAGPEPPRAEFVQNIRLTPAHVRAIAAGRLGLADLIAEGVAEWITPEEQENCLIAMSIDELRAHQHDATARFSHCDVEQTIFGLAALVAPFANHTQPARVTMLTNQARQTCGWYALNFPYRTDKIRMFQFYCETPLVATIIHRWTPSNGSNVFVAYAAYLGDNMEDSVIVNQASVDRGLFNGAFFRFEVLELEKGEMFASPDAFTTKNLKPNASYEKLVDGFIRKGAIARYGDVLIGRVAKLTRGHADERYQYTDRSLVYRNREPAVVEDVLRPRGANAELFGVVKLRFERPLRVGDKLSSRSGNKSIVASLLPQCDMPFMENGMTPDMIVSICSMPTRMTIGQLIETTQAKINARRGVISDGTAFLPVDHDAMAAELVGQGFRFNGRERMYNGISGEYFDTALFVGPIASQRLQKFVLDDEQAVGSTGPTDAITGQPLGGKQHQGGLRLGEMEAWALFSNGVLFSYYEKCLQDSDARVVHVCRGCGLLGAHNEREGVYSCRLCGEMADLAAVDSGKSATAFNTELAASNLRMRLGLAPRQYETGRAAIFGREAAEPPAP